ncbi:DUF866 domain-containing protein, partial [Escherichia coli]|nr:DUF866 domain-containing protein [Escherichia coli]
TGKFSEFSWDDKVDIPDSRGGAHLVQRCKLCPRVFTVSIVSTPRDGVYLAYVRARARSAAQSSQRAHARARTCTRASTHTRTPPCA